MYRVRVEFEYSGDKLTEVPFSSLDEARACYNWHSAHSLEQRTHVYILDNDDIVQSNMDWTMWK